MDDIECAVMPPKYIFLKYFKKIDLSMLRAVSVNINAKEKKPKKFTLKCKVHSTILVPPLYTKNIFRIYCKTPNCRTLAQVIFFSVVFHVDI